MPGLLGNDGDDKNVQFEINNAGMSDKENEEDAHSQVDIYQDELDGLQDMNNDSDMSPLTGQMLQQRELVPNYLLLSSSV
eukprot:10696700-Ditylum_brightwellii.AAC.1